MKPIFSLSILVMISLAFLSACSSTPSTSDSMVSITPKASTTSSSTSNTASMNRVQQRTRGGHHGSVTPEVKSISSGSTVSNTDGTITIEKEVSYITPAGTISTDFTLTTDANGVITAVEAVYQGNDHEDAMYHNWFNSSTSQIVGKNIKNLSLDTIGGASLTTDAFNKMMTTL